MEWQVRVLEQTIARLSPKGEAVAARFYETLFEGFPNVRPLFSEVSMKDQYQKFWSTLTITTLGFRFREQLTETLLELGSKHKAYGVRPEDYDIVRITLLKVFEEFLGETWSPEMHLAWSLALYEVSQIMLKGAAQMPLAESQH